MVSPVGLNKIAHTVSNVANKGCQKLGSAISKSNFAQGAFKKIDPTHSNNTFLGLLGLMTLMVIVPRVKTAATRNPDNKEATADEIKEILFRDIQTVGIILFALKIINTLISRGASKLTGVPLTNKPFNNVFETNAKGFKGIKEKSVEFIKHPIQKLKIIGKNVLDTIHPTGGVVKLNNEAFKDKYSGFGSIEQINKMYDEIAGNKGDVEKNHNMVMDDIIANQESLIKNQASISHAGFSSGSTGKANEVLENLKLVKEQGVSALKNENLNPNVRELIVDFFKNPDNKLVRKGKTLNAYLSTLALAIESGYLGFGLPALNQMRLEKKYLSKEKLNITQEPMNKFSYIQKRLLKPNEAQIFQKFIK